MLTTPKGHRAAGKTMSMKNSSDPIGISKTLVFVIPRSSVFTRPAALVGTDFPIIAVSKWSELLQAFYFDYYKR